MPLGFVVIGFLLPSNIYGLCGGNNFIPYLVFFLTGIFPILVAIKDLKRKKITKTSFIIILIPTLLFVLFFSLVFFVSSARPVNRGLRTKAEMHQLIGLQEIFYARNDRYADTQEELGLIEEDDKFRDNQTGEELTDRDGEGIEGSDNDPETWLVTAYIRFKEINPLCIVASEGYWFTCTQDGCYEEK